MKTTIIPNPAQINSHKMLARPFLLGLALFLFIPQDAWTRPVIRRGFFNAYPSAVGSVLDNVPSKAGHCGVCHYDFNGSGTRTPYGEALKNTGITLKDDAAVSNAVWMIRNSDSDGDGFSNLTEITDTTSLTSTRLLFPGSPRPMWARS